MRLLVAAVALTMAIPTAGWTLDAEGTMKGRQALMAYIGGNMRTLAGMARGSAEFNAEFVQTFGRSVAAIATALPHLFPEGTGKDAGQTEADAAIFADPDGFKEMAESLGAAALAVSNSADASELAGNLSAMSGACSSCHSNYRSK